MIFAGVGLARVTPSVQLNSLRFLSNIAQNRYYSINKALNVPNRQHFHGMKPIRMQRLSFSCRMSSSNTSKRKPNTGRTIIWEMMQYIWPKGHSLEVLGIKTRVVLALSLLVGAKIVTIQVPYVFKYIVDSLNDPESSNKAYFLGKQLADRISVETLVALPLVLTVFYGISRASVSLFDQLRAAIFASVAQNAIRNVSRDVFHHLLHLDLAFHLNRETGKLSRIIDRGGRSINFLMNSLVFRVFPTLFELSLVSSILAYSFGVRYSLITISTLAVYGTFTILVTQWRNEIRKQMNTLENQANSKAIDTLINYETVKLFNNEEFETKSYDKFLYGFQKASLNTQTSLNFLNFGQQLIFSIGLTAIMGCATSDILQGSMTIGDLILVNGLLYQLSVPLNFVGSVYREIRQSLIDMDDLYKLRNETSSLNTDKGKLQLIGDDLKKDFITFKDVKFSYLDTRSILNGLNLTIGRNESVALVGDSGCGKSTILKLLYRFHDPNEGTISINGHSLPDYNLNALRKNISVVPQDIVLFNETLEYNLRYGDVNAKLSVADLEDIAEKLQLGNLIRSLPDGLKTNVGERGLKLSGGEKQRISIGRALLKQADILLFDESTSFLDFKTEQEIMKNIRNVTKEKTVIIVAHRLNTIKDVDRIVVLSNGQVVEEGSHDALLQLKSNYYELWQTQQAESTKSII